MKKHIHFIGICGVAMSALAIAFKKAGYTVSGSDVGFYPPVSTMLEKSGVTFYPGWHPEKMLASNLMGTVPDLVIVGNVASSTNPEWLAVQTKKIPYQSYPEAIAEFFVKEKSIVCAGTYGKTTTTALLAWIFSELKLKSSYMFGGLATGEFPSAALVDSDWSILEGDEYKSARWDNGPKFAHYNAKYLLLTSVNWDHADVYPTEASYFEAFEKLVASIPADGMIVVSTDNKNALDSTTKVVDGPLVVTYGKDSDAMYCYKNVTQSDAGLNFEIHYQEKNISITCPLLGLYQAENITGAFAMANELLRQPEKIAAAIATFPGLKRRLEKRSEGPTPAGVTVFDDIAHSPTKAKYVLETLRKIYTGKIIAVFEPNTGNRKSESLPQYDHAFAAADEVVIPRLTKVKIDVDDLNPPFDGEELAETIGKTHTHVNYIDDDKKLVHHLISRTKKNDIIVFLGSHGFRGMIEELISKLK